LPFDRSNARVRRGATYDSADGRGKVPIEVSLDLYRTGATEPFLVWLWECKEKGRRRVEINVVRELRSKIEEIGVSRCSGSIVTTNGFQRGAVDLAAAIGISLYLLQERLVPITKYAKKSDPDTRKVLYAPFAQDGSGKVHCDLRFDDLVRLELRRHWSQPSPFGDVGLSDS
jgi:hypothetical protein